jgi:hypothetical protein
MSHKFEILDITDEDIESINTQKVKFNSISKGPCEKSKSYVLCVEEYRFIEKDGRDLIPL